MRETAGASRAVRAALATLAILGLVSFGRSARAQTGSTVVTVNGEMITQDEFYDRLQRVRAQDFIANLNPLSIRPEAAGQLVMNSLIVERLVLQLATRDNVLPTEAQVNEEVQLRKKQPDIAQMLSLKMVTEDALKYDIKVQQARYNLATEKATVTAPQIEEWYKKHLADFKIPERWKLAGLITTKAANVPLIEADLKANKKIGDVAKQYSEEEHTKDHDGEIGTLSANDPKIPEPMKVVIEKMKVNEISAPIKIESDAGPKGDKKTLWWIVQLLGREPEVTRPFQDVKSYCERMALLEQAGGMTVADKKLVEYRQRANILVSLPGYNVFNHSPAPNKP